MKLFSYIVSHDKGFAPNPFWGYCTLATCKPAIRRTAKKGDLIVGLSPKAKGHRVVYVMRVDDIMTFDKYFRDPQFARKIPDYTTGNEIHKCGDNCYEPGHQGRFRQLRSMHSKGCGENPTNKKRDLDGIHVLISQHFCYFGPEAPLLPRSLNELKVGRSHKCRFSEQVIKRVVHWMDSQPSGVQTSPTKWRAGDDSWRMGCGKARRHTART